MTARRREGYRYEQIEDESNQNAAAAGETVLVAGLAAIAIWVGSIVRTSVSQDWANWVFERKVRGQPAVVSQYLESWFRSRTDSKLPVTEERKPPVTEERPPTSTEKPPAFGTGDMIGRLALPRLKLHAVVREGSGASTLDLALGHIPGTAFPGNREMWVWPATAIRSSAASDKSGGPTASSFRHSPGIMSTRRNQPAS